MFISRVWCSKNCKPGEEMFTNEGFAAMAVFEAELAHMGLLPVKFSRAESELDTVYRLTRYWLTLECEINQEPGKYRKPFWQWYLQNKPEFKRVRSAAELQSIEDETQMDPAKLVA